MGHATCLRKPGNYKIFLVYGEGFESWSKMTQAGSTRVSKRITIALQELLRDSWLLADLRQYQLILYEK